jgi:hypothetical protein
MSGLRDNLQQKYKGNPLFLLLLVTAAAISASTPPATLPRGFLEQLPMFLEMPDKEYDTLLQATDSDESKKPIQKVKQPSGTSQ